MAPYSRNRILFGDIMVKFISFFFLTALTFAHVDTSQILLPTLPTDDIEAIPPGGIFEILTPISIPANTEIVDVFRKRFSYRGYHAAQEHLPFFRYDPHFDKSYYYDYTSTAVCQLLVVPSDKPRVLGKTLLKVSSTGGFSFGSGLTGIIPITAESYIKFSPPRKVMERKPGPTSNRKTEVDTDTDTEVVKVRAIGCGETSPYWTRGFTLQDFCNAVGNLIRYRQPAITVE